MSAAEEQRRRIVGQRCRTAIATFKGELEALGPGVGGRERALAITNAEQALMWAEKGLE